MDRVEANHISECKSMSSKFLVFHCSYFVCMYFLEREVYSGEFNCLNIVYASKMVCA